jgi:hypothetical protein
MYEQYARKLAALINRDEDWQAEAVAQKGLGGLAYWAVEVWPTAEPAFRRAIREQYEYHDLRAQYGRVQAVTRGAHIRPPRPPRLPLSVDETPPNQEDETPPNQEQEEETPLPLPPLSPSERALLQEAYAALRTWCETYRVIEELTQTDLIEQIEAVAEARWFDPDLVNKRRKLVSRYPSL